jgi:small subunit ribosomal protein S1
MSNPEEEDFAALFEASVRTRSLTRGQTIEGRIVRIGAEVALVDVGGKGEAVLDVAELKDENGVLEAAVGDRIEATVVSTSGGVTLSRRLMRGAATLRRLEDAFRSGLAVDGKVEREVKGGYEVRIGGQRGFCPQSQIDVVKDTKPEVHVGQSYRFRILEFKDGGKDLVVSRRVLQAEEQQAQADAVWATITQAFQLRHVYPGRVTRLAEFGAFVELQPGLEGLAHASTFPPTGSKKGWTKLAAVGTTGDFEILSIDAEQRRIALAMVPEGAAKGEAAAAATTVGARVTGTVDRHERFGVFVFLGPGRTALMPLSEAGLAKGEDAATMFPPGSPIEVIVTEVGADGRRIRVSRQAVIAAAEAAELQEYNSRAGVPSSMSSLAEQLQNALTRGRR